MRAGADERAIGEAGLEPLFPDPAHRPAAVVDRMIGLNRRDDALFSEARQRVRLHMLDMLDAKAAVARAVGGGDGGHGVAHDVVYRKSGGEGKSVTVRLDPGGPR